MSVPDRIYRLHDVTEIVGLKKSTIYALIAKGEFPPPVKLTAKARGWLASDVTAWIESRKQAR